MNIRPEHVHYDTVEQWIRQCLAQGHSTLFDPILFDIELRRLSEEYNFPYESLFSFYRNCQLPHTKRTAPKVKASLDRYLSEYRQGTTILELAKRANFSPHLFSRYIVEALTLWRGKILSEALRDPEAALASADSIIEMYRDSEDAVIGAAPTATTRLAKEVIEAQHADPLNSPQSDMERHCVGLEYECVLEFRLREMGVEFETETELRDKGTSRTPDILLLSPLAIKDGSEWKIIQWIDSKALFGDAWTHTSSVLPQAESYVHRFGPGLILYWFGHAPLNTLGHARGDLAICGWDVPSAFMSPDGRILRKEHR